MDGNGETTILFNVLIWKHPIETTIKNCLCGVPGWCEFWYNSHNNISQHFFLWMGEFSKTFTKIGSFFVFSRVFFTVYFGRIFLKDSYLHSLRYLASLGFASKILGKHPNNTLLNGGFIGDLPWYNPWKKTPYVNKYMDIYIYVYIYIYKFFWANCYTS